MSLLSHRLKRLRGSVRVSVLVGVLVGILVPAWLWASAPAWWTTRGVLVPGATADDYAAVNQGQVKHIAKQAYEEMKAAFVGGAGATLDAIWASPAPSTDDYRAINIGQLKTVAKPFYDRLAEVDPTIGYPWASATTPADDFALVNIGQVKNLFSFDPQAIAAAAQPPTVDDLLAPQILLIPSVEYTSAASATLNGRVTPADGTTLAGLWLNNQAFTPLQAGDLSATVTLVEGVNNFTLKATDSLGHTRSVKAKITRDTALPALAITSPSSGAVIAASSVNISGTVSGATPLRAVTVNGVSAYLSAVGYEAAAVPLTAGANVLTVTATDILGKVRIATINVTSLPPAADPTTGIVPDAVTVVATPVEGSAPLLVNFTVVNTAPGTLLQVVYDFEGTRKNLVTATTLAPVAHVYNNGGVYYPVVTVRTSAGSFTNKTGPSVPVAQRLKIKVSGADSPLVAWAAMKQCLAVQDINGAAECMSSERQAGFIAMMNNLGPDEALKMANDFGTLSMEQTYDDVAQYNADIATPIGVVTFPVSFIKEGGKWRIDSF